MAQPAPLSPEEQVLAQINRILLLKIKTVIVKNLHKEDIPAFEQIVKENNSNKLLAFANEKILHLAEKLNEEIQDLNRNLHLPPRQNGI